MTTSVLSNIGHFLAERYPWFMNRPLKPGIPISTRQPSGNHGSVRGIIAHISRSFGFWATPIIVDIRQPDGSLIPVVVPAEAVRRFDADMTLGDPIVVWGDIRPGLFTTPNGVQLRAGAEFVVRAWTTPVANSGGGCRLGLVGMVRDVRRDGDKHLLELEYESADGPVTSEVLLSLIGGDPQESLLPGSRIVLSIGLTLRYAHAKRRRVLTAYGFRIADPCL